MELVLKRISGIGFVHDCLTTPLQILANPVWLAMPDVVKQHTALHCRP